MENDLMLMEVAIGQTSDIPVSFCWIYTCPGILGISCDSDR